MLNTEHLICPVCQKPLKPAPQSLICISGHSFDLAGKGYVNLLLSQDKNSKDPGDNKEMATARKQFLDKSYYSILAEKLRTIVIGMINKNSETFILDAGCGDGYYTNHLSLGEEFSSVSICGVDISKEAIRLASGRNKSIDFIVASLFKMPFRNNCADVIINAFAPSSDSEFSRILKNNGFLITVIPGRSHLIELKSVLYDKPYENDEKEPELTSFKAEGQARVKASIKIGSQEDLSNLVSMTPYGYRTPKEGLARLHMLDSLETTIEFIISLYKKL